MPSLVGVLLKFCDQCGNKLGKEDTHFCSTCGIKLENVSTEPVKLISKKEKQKEPEIAKVNSPSILIFAGFKDPIIIAIVFALIVALFLSVDNFNKITSNLNERITSLDNELAKYKNLYTTEVELTKSEKAQKDNLELQLQTLNSQLGVKETEIAGLRSQIQGEQSASSSLQGQLSTTQQQLAQQKAQLDVAKKESQEVLNTLNRLDTWTSNNAQLNSNLFSSVSQCGQYTSKINNICQIDVNKIGSDMLGCIGFRWINDTITSNYNKNDVLYDVGTFYTTKQGDCDDFALFGAAWVRSEYNKAKQICSEDKIQMKVSQSIAVACPCSTYVVCGMLRSGGGHCEVGIARLSISPNAPSFFNNVYIVEPQGGAYKGTASSEFQTIWNIFSYNDFIIYSNDNVYSSIKSSKEKLVSYLGDLNG